MDLSESLLTVGSEVGDALSVPIDFSNEENGPCLGPLEDLLSLELQITDTDIASIFYRSTTQSPDTISFEYSVSGISGVFGIVSDDFIPNSYAPSVRCLYVRASAMLRKMRLLLFFLKKAVLHFDLLTCGVVRVYEESNTNFLPLFFLKKNKQFYSESKPHGPIE